VLPRTETIIAAARLRREVGNPPGKSGSAGDAINWETILANPPSDDLYFVTADSDYSSPVDPARFNEFLLAEWMGATSKSLYYYTQLSRFFKEKFPTIQLADEVEKDLLAQALLASGSFAETHRLVGKLSQYSAFTPTQAALIAEAATTNDQVGSIASDSDVRALLRRIVTKYASHLGPRSLKILRDFYGIAEQE